MKRTCSRMDHCIEPCDRSGATVRVSPTDRRTLVMAAPGLPGMRSRSASTEAMSEAVSALVIHDRCWAVSRLGSPPTTVSRNAATTRTFEVDHARLLGTEPSMVTAEGLSSGANAMALRVLPLSVVKAAEDDGVLVRVERGVGFTVVVAEVVGETAVGA